MRTLVLSAKRLAACPSLGLEWGVSVELHKGLDTKTGRASAAPSAVGPLLVKELLPSKARAGQRILERHATMANVQAKKPHIG